MPQKKTGLKPLSALIWLLEQRIWCTQQKQFRNLYDQAVLKALDAAKVNGDSLELTKIVNAVPDASARDQIAAAIVKAYPTLTYSKKDRRFKKDRSKKKMDQFAVAPVFSVFRESNYTIKEREIVLHQNSYNKNEALELVLDVLTQFRNDLTIEDLHALETTMARIEIRAARNAPQNH